MSNFYCVVIRHLPNQIPVVTAIITQPQDPVDDLDNYFRSEAEDKIADFKKRFAEFKKAEFYIQKINTWGYEVECLS